MERELSQEAVIFEASFRHVESLINRVLGTHRSIQLYI